MPACAFLCLRVLIVDSAKLQALMLESRQHSDPLCHPLNNSIPPTILVALGIFCALGEGLQVAAIVVYIVTIDRALKVIFVASAAPCPASVFTVAKYTRFIAGRCL